MGKLLVTQKDLEAIDPTSAFRLLLNSANRGFPAFDAIPTDYVCTDEDRHHMVKIWK